MLVAENAEQTGGIFPTRHLKCAAVWVFPQSICMPSRVWSVRLLGRKHGLPAKVPVFCVAIISFCLFFSTLLRDTQDLTTLFFQ